MRKYHQTLLEILKGILPIILENLKETFPRNRLQQVDHEHMIIWTL